MTQRTITKTAPRKKTAHSRPSTPRCRRDDGGVVARARAEARAVLSDRRPIRGKSDPRAQLLQALVANTWFKNLRLADHASPTFRQELDRALDDVVMAWWRTTSSAKSK